MVPTLPAGDHTDPATKGAQLRIRNAPRSGTVTRAWLFRYLWKGKEWVRMTIGHHPQMSLADARARVLELRTHWMMA
jgi:hypothetical protein